MISFLFNYAYFYSPYKNYTVNNSGRNSFNITVAPK